MRWPLLIAAGIAFGCSGDDEQSPAGSSCVEGEQRKCDCPGGGQGAQICNAGGKSYGSCFGCVGGGGFPSGGTAGASSGGTAGSSSGGTAGASSGGTAGSSSGGTGAVAGSPSKPPFAKFPAPGPDEYALVQQVAADHPDWLANSCVDTGGNNDFLFEVVRRLRKKDDRWGLNWKRGVVGDLSQDVVDYHYGEGVSEGSQEVYIFDMITGHCGASPSAGWIDQTQATLDANTIGIWTLAGQNL